MTTFQDQQPQSRRAVRQSERADGAESQAGFTEGHASAPMPYPAPAGDMWDTTSRRAAQLPPVAPPQQDQAARRPATPGAAQPEPLHYSTQSRPVLPSHDGPTFRSRGTAAPQPVPFVPSAPVPAAAPQSEQPAYRVRDFSPEARSTVSESRAASRASAPAPSDLDYHTEARFRAAAAAAPLAPISEVPASVAPINRLWATPAPASAAPAAEAPAEPEPAAQPAPAAEPAVLIEPAPAAERPVAQASELPFEHTLTRRELRAMQQAEEARSQQSQPAAVAFPLIEPPVAPSPAAPVVASAPVLPAAPVSSSPFESLFSPPSAPAPSPLIAEVPAAIVPTPAVDAPAPWTPPKGHWSTQIDEEDIETTISRRIGSGTTATSALVLPEIPNGTDIRGPLTSTGEIMLTGSIELPRNLAATGQSDRFDHGGIDELFDLSDAEVTSTDSSPVRAIRAVSTHTSGHGVTHTQKPKGTRALTALLIAASSMAVVVAGLLVAAFAFNVFG
ncbi:hypothetical protein BH09ACT5_BH09ACT5_10030 [soil metagenome]